ncbi:hypothetical protein [Sphingomonas sp. Leaf357]|uniref:hypothetical protein n=1 Tax=Sphingomonas sp. Leaf357 TaxID=1736350 RepID=UPI000AC15EE9|nr:hypothetical protein [Sphingomonas sp. Leaf357]
MTLSKASQAENTVRADDWEDADEPWTLRALKRGERETLLRWSKYRLPNVTPLASFADYAAAAEKRADIARARSVSETELRKAVTEIARGIAARQEDQTAKQAQAILDGRANEAFEGFEELKSQQARLSQQLKVYGVALRTQEGVVAEIRSERSIDAADAMRPAHQAAVADIAVAVAQLREAFDREEAARTLVTKAGYDARLPSFSPGTAMRQGGQLDEIERRAREYTR